MAAVALFEWNQNRSRHKVGKMKEIIDLSLATALTPVVERLTVVETKIDVFWRSVAMNQANILHQPHPDRAHIDILLEAWKSGGLTPTQDVQLKHYLHLIRDYEPGTDVGFPVRDGEQTAAGMFLATMDLA
jgi:hypothetical protein